MWGGVGWWVSDKMKASARGECGHGQNVALEMSNQGDAVMRRGAASAWALGLEKREIYTHGLGFCIPTAVPFAFLPHGRVRRPLARVVARPGSEVLQSFLLN